MKQYHFVSTWSLEAPIESVWDAIQHSESWPSWWRGVPHVEELVRGDDNGIGNVRRYTFRSLLPYDLVFDMRTTRADAPHALEGTATGELTGTGRWSLEQVGAETRVRYEWDVGTSRPWMNALAPLAAPLFAWNHDVIMRWGEEGLRAHLGLAPAVPRTPVSPARRFRVVAVGVAVAVAAVVLSRRPGHRGAPREAASRRDCSE